MGASVRRLDSFALCRAAYFYVQYFIFSLRFPRSSLFLPDCLLVAKDGVIIHETYFSNTSESLYETDSLGKTSTAVLMGIPVHDGDIDIDTPIVQYGVKPQAIWNASGPNYFENVTLRHILAQVQRLGGVCVRTSVVVGVHAHTAYKETFASE